MISSTVFTIFFFIAICMAYEETLQLDNTDINVTISNATNANVTIGNQTYSNVTIGNLTNASICDVWVDEDDIDYDDMGTYYYHDGCSYYFNENHDNLPNNFDDIDQDGSRYYHLNGSSYSYYFIIGNTTFCFNKTHHNGNDNDDHNGNDNDDHNGNDNDGGQGNDGDQGNDNDQNDGDDCNDNSNSPAPSSDPSPVPSPDTSPDPSPVPSPVPSLNGTVLVNITLNNENVTISIPIATVVTIGGDNNQTIFNGTINPVSQPNNTDQFGNNAQTEAEESYLLSIRTQIENRLDNELQSTNAQRRSDVEITARNNVLKFTSLFLLPQGTTENDKSNTCRALATTAEAFSNHTYQRNCDYTNVSNSTKRQANSGDLYLISTYSNVDGDGYNSGMVFSVSLMAVFIAFLVL